MVERAFNDKTNLQYKGQNHSPGTKSSRHTTNPKGSSADGRPVKKSVRTKEKLKDTKDEKESSPQETQHFERAKIDGRFGKLHHGKPHCGQEKPDQPKRSRAGSRRPPPRTPETTGSRVRAKGVDSCASQRQRDSAKSQHYQSSSNRSSSKGSKDTRTFQPISSSFLKYLLQMEPSEAAIQLGSMKGSFAAGLEEPTMDTRRQRIFWNALAHISENDGAGSTVIMLYAMVVGSKFFKTHLQLRLLNLRAQAHQKDHQECVRLIAVILTVFESMLQCIPSRVADIKVPLVLMSDVVGLLGEQTTHDVKPSLLALLQFIESLEAEKELSRQKQRNASSKPPPDDFRQHSILPTYQELISSYQPYLRPHIVKGAYPDAEHYLDVQFRLMKEDFIQPLRSGLAEYMHNKQVRPENRVKVQDIRIYENVKLDRAMTDRSGVSYRMSFKRIPNVRWEVSKRLIYGSLVLLSDDDFKTYIPATVANSEARQLSRGLVEIRPIDEGMSSMVDRTFVMVESTVFFEAYRHVLVGLQRVNPETFPMADYILDLDPEIEPPPYLLKQSHPKLDVSNLMARNKQSQSNTTKDKKAADAPYPISVLNKDAWPVAEKTTLNPSQLEAVKVALTQELSLIQGPPGTGKTYIGLKIVETLLRNMNSWSDNETGPIMLVCYTNHALDQFLLGIMQFQDTGIIRVGGRSKCEELEPRNLKNVIRENRGRRSRNSQYIRRRAGNIRQETVVAKRALEGSQLRMQLSTEGILRETEFNRFHIMSDKHFKSLTRMKTIGHADSWMIEWLVPDDVSLTDLSPNLEKGNVCDDTDRKTSGIDTKECDTVTESIDVENERHVIEAQRMFDDDDETEDNDLPEENVKKNDYPIAVFFADLWSSNDISRRVKNFLKEKISMQRQMNENHVSTIRDVWRLDVHQRWALYFYWLSEYLAMLKSQIPVFQNEYIQLCEELKETNDHEKCIVLQQATIIGMTTTRAANEREMLHRVKPKIMIVEEAAEVLESHIITSLHTSCEQLILIGDHQQLRPKPNVYKLATRFHLDVSMFERMVKNGFPYKKLHQQHRMRPEISSVMRDHFYPELEDHDSVSSYEDVHGMEKNVFFLDHSKDEAHIRETMSHYNLHEVDFTVALCKYLLNQDYKPEQITILTAYTGQLLKFKERMDRSTFEGVKVVSVDNYQGEENDIILLSFVRSSQNGKIGFLNIANRVCVSLSRAKKGLYCIGNFSLYAEKCSLWKGIYDDLKAKCRTGDMMILQCYNHPDNKTEVSQAEDFRKVPEGGCGIPCDTLLDCGHVCVKKCHPKDRLHKEYICPEQCTRTCEMGHVCPDICGMECLPCRTMVEKELPCGHVRMMMCSTDPTSIDCMVLVEKLKFPCKHLLTLSCHLDVNELDCTAIVDRLLRCGHTKTEMCSEHGTCSVIVFKDLPCGHIRSLECSQRERSDIVCLEMVLKILPCSHSKELKCHVQPDKASCLKVVLKTRQSCGHIVKEKCSAKSDCIEIVTKRLPCGHHKDVQCCEDPNDMFCQEPCERSLSCGHKCTGICGEDCVTHCNTIITRRDWPCGHEVTARCSDGPATCKVRCENKLECGHMCKGTCGKCMNGRYHRPCGEKCDRTLVCGHKCTLSCDSPCLPCQEKCGNVCNHIQCDHLCGEVCPPCTKHCVWKCPHYTCRMLCCEPCTRPPCNAPCPKKLAKCGHTCSGLCGEICPLLCKTCDTLALVDASFGSQDIEELRYIQLEDCGHVFEVNGLDKHMGLGKAESKNTLISLQRCPTCRTPIRQSRRYGNILKQTKKHVMHVKKKFDVKKRQVDAEKSAIKRNMKGTLTLRNLKPLGIGQNLISKWLCAHQVINIEGEPARNRLQLIHTLTDLHTTLINGTEDTPTSSKSRRGRREPSNESRTAKQSEWKGYIDDTMKEMEVLGNAILMDSTTFSYQQAHDLHKEICKITYAVMMLIQLQSSTDRANTKILERFIKVLCIKAPIRDDELKQMQFVLEEYYRATRKEWPDNLREFHIQRQLTFSRERWCRCPKGHTFMVEEEEAIDCEICLQLRARERTDVHGPRHVLSASGNSTDVRKSQDAIRRMAIEVPSCGARRGPGETPYKKNRSLTNSLMDSGLTGSLKKSPAKIDRSAKDIASTRQGKDTRNGTLAHPEHKTSGVDHEESKTNSRRRRQKKTKQDNGARPQDQQSGKNRATSSNPVETPTASMATSRTQARPEHKTSEVDHEESKTNSRRRRQEKTKHDNGARPKDQQSVKNRATPSNPVETPITPKATSKTCSETGKPDSASRNKGKGKITGSNEEAVQHKRSNSTGPHAGADHDGRNETSRRRRPSRRRPRGRGEDRRGDISQMENQDSKKSDDPLPRSATVERGSFNAGRRIRRRNRVKNGDAKQ